jgi:hypothetical protein
MNSFNSSCCGSMFKLLEVRSTAPYNPTFNSGYAPRSISMNKNNLDYDKINVFKTYNSRLQNTRVSSPIKHRTRSPSVSNNDRSS